MKIERFEDIMAWQEAPQLVKQVYKAIASNKEFAKDSRMLSNFIKYLKSQAVLQRDEPV
jgi:hypothetical protein